MHFFTKSQKVEKEVVEYEIDNNPILGFLQEVDIEDIVNEATCDVYKRYTVYCNERSMAPMSNIVFSKQTNKRLGLEVVQRKIDGSKKNIFVRG